MAKSMNGAGKRTGGLASRLPLRALWWAGAVLVVAVAAALGTRALWRKTAARPEFAVDPLALTPGAYPAWVKGAKITGEIRGRLAQVPSGRSIFDRGLAAAVGHALQRSPWIAEVTSVERNLPNSLKVTIVFRKPAGLVAMGGRQYMVDKQGRWLPDDLFARPPEWRGEHLPVIVDRLLRTGPAPGQAWDGPRLAVGARLSEFFRERGLLKRLDLATIDVTGVGRKTDPDVVLVTADGAQIKWGKSSVYAAVSGLERPAFLVPDREKLAMLSSKLRDYPGLKGVSYVDLRFHGQVVFAEDNQATALRLP